MIARTPKDRAILAAREWLADPGSPRKLAAHIRAARILVAVSQPVAPALPSRKPRQRRHCREVNPVHSQEGEPCLLWWCGWDVPDEIPHESMLAAWPSAMRGWCSGAGFGYRTFVGAVWARSPADAETLIQSCYGPDGYKINMRWDPEPRQNDWSPGSRFLGKMPSKSDAEASP